MKVISNIMFVLFIMVSLSTLAQSNDGVEWVALEQTQELMKDNAKPIFIEFTAAWCGWCKKMDQTTFSDKKVISVLNKDFYAVKLNFDSSDSFEFNGGQYTSKSLAKEYGVEGLPTMLVIGSDLKSFEKLVGYRKPKDFLNSIGEY